MKRAGDASQGSQKRVVLDDKTILRHQNRELGLAVQRTKGELNETRTRLAELEAERDLFDATNSIVDRAWRLLDEELLSLAQSIGLNDIGKPSPTRVEIETNGTLPSSSKLITTLADPAYCYVLADATRKDEEEEEDDEAANANLHVDLEASLKQRIQWTSRLLSKLIESISKGDVSENVANLHAQIRSLEARVLLQASKLKVNKQRIREISAALDSAKMEVWRLSRKLDGIESGDTTIVGVSQEAPSSSGMDVVADRLANSTTPASMAGEPTSSSSSAAAAVTTTETSPAVKKDASGEGSSELRSKLEEITEIAAGRLEEIKKLREQVKEAMMQTPVLASSSTSGTGNGELDREMRKQRQEKDDLAKQLDKANSISLMALKKLRQAEARIKEWESAADAISKMADSVLSRENTQLKQALEETRSALNQKEVELESLRTLAVSNEEINNMLQTIREERDSYKRRFEEFQNKGQQGGEDSDALISEIEQMSSALNASRESLTKLQRLLGERDKVVSELTSEKAILEADLRELREEKNALALRSEKAQVVLKENEALIARLDDRLASERMVIQRAEEMARASAEACEKALNEREQFKREAEAEREKAAAATALEEELKASRVRTEEIKWELTQAEEEIKTLKRRLDRARAAVEAAARAEASSTNKGGMRTIDEERLEAMTTALRCPVYQHLWRDCVITKCAHMFSRKALEDNLAQRNRKCPSCKNTYSKDDILNVYLYQSNDV